MEVLGLKSRGLSHELIAKAAGISENTMREYFALYQAGGVDKLKEVQYFCPQSKLTAHVSSLEAYFQANPPASIKEAQSEIKELTGIKRSETQVREFLKKTQAALSQNRDDPR